MADKIVLYAEDEFSNQELLRYKFKEARIPIEIVSDGTEAIERCLKKEYSVIILDHYMKDLDGIEAARQIRKMNPTLPLIAITSDDELRSEMLEAGFDQVVIKPLRDSIIIDIVKSYF